MTKDRAAPFSRKHRRYWIPVTGGMLLIGAINVGLGLTIYRAPTEPDRIDVMGESHGSDTIAPNALPAPVVRAFVARYPHTIATGATRDAQHDYVIAFPATAAHHHATFAPDGAFVRED